MLPLKTCWLQNNKHSILHATLYQVCIQFMLASMVSSPYSLMSHIWPHTQHIKMVQINTGPNKKCQYPEKALSKTLDNDLAERMPLPH